MLLKEKNRRLAVYMLAVCLCLFMALSGFVTFITYKNYCSRVNTALSAILYEIKEQYPLVQEKALLHILNQTDLNAPMDLSDFGIEADTIPILNNMKQGWYQSILYFFPVIIGFGILSTLILFFYFSQENKKLTELTEYIHAIYEKKYDLCLRENEEGMISRLKNELYKITVMLKEQAETSQKEKKAMGDSMADISHQIKTPMTSVLILLDNLREHTMPEETRQTFLTEIHQQIIWVNSLVISLLKLSRLESGVADIEMKLEKIPLYELFTEIKNNLSILAEAANVHVKIQNHPSIAFLGDKHWETEALTNLLKNAIEHTTSGCEVKVSFEDNFFYTGILIEDQGEGMEEEEQQRIFDRFYRGEHASPGGVGIGLSLAKKIIEKDHGTIRVKSKKGRGSVFVIRYTKS